jgi:HlyD family secretion protein
VPAPRNESVFRKVALDRLASPEQLDLLMTVTGPRSWLALTAIGILISAALVWGFTGSIPTRIEGQGVLIKAGGVFDVFVQGTGPLADITVAEGADVREGQVIGRIQQPEMETAIRNAKAALGEQRREHDRLQGFARRDLSLMDDSQQLQRASAEDTVRFSESRLKALQDQLANEEQLLEKGLITRQQVLGTRQTIFTTQDQLERSRSQLKQLTITGVSTRTQREQEIVRSQLQLNDAERRIESMEEQLKIQTEIVSGYAGRVLEVKANAGDILNRGQSIVSLQLTGGESQELQAIVYIPPKDGKYVENAMETQISPLSAPREEYGFIKGQVTYVSQFPSTRQGMVRVLANDGLVQTLSADGAPFAVYAKLFPKPSTLAGYEWSSPAGEKLVVNSGMICRVTITVRSRRPIDLIVPTLREKLGV